LSTRNASYRPHGQVDGIIKTLASAAIPSCQTTCLLQLTRPGHLSALRCSPLVRLPAIYRLRRAAVSNPSPMTSLLARRCHSPLLPYQGGTAHILSLVQCPYLPVFIHIARPTPYVAGSCPSRCRHLSYKSGVRYLGGCWATDASSAARLRLSLTYIRLNTCFLLATMSETHIHISLDR